MRSSLLRKRSAAIISLNQSHVCAMATHSIESECSKAYSSDLRWRMVYQRSLLGLSYNQIARNLNVDPSTVHRTVKLFDETGTVCSIQGFHVNITKKLSIHGELAIIEMVLDDPSVYLHELQHHVFHTSGNTISTSSICRFLQQQCFFTKKLTFRAQQRSEQLREKYTEEMSVYDPEIHTRNVCV